MESITFHVKSTGHTIATIEVSAPGGLVLEIIAFVWSLFFGSEGHAPESWLTPLVSPAPEYPEHLRKAHYSGKVRLYIDVDNRGAVQGARMVESSHPDLAHAVRQATARWRFKPWAVSESLPRQVELMVLVLFGRQSDDTFSPEITIGLDNASCAYLNREIALSRQDYPTAPLSDVDLFAYTAELLESRFVRLRVPSQAARNDLLTQLNKAIPAVVKRCGQAPARRYAEFLPKDVRAALAWGAVQPGFRELIKK